MSNPREVAAAQAIFEALIQTNGSATHVQLALAAVRAIERMEDPGTRMADALRRIKAWCEAYPVKAFPEPSDSALAEAQAALDARPTAASLPAMHASWARHLVDGIGKIAKEGLGDE